jgi:ferredoxin
MRRVGNAEWTLAPRGTLHILALGSFRLPPMTYRLKIDRTLCSGYAECIGIAPEVFALGEDNICVIVDPEAGDDESVLDAARACPVDAITVVDEYEEQVWPA